MEYIDILIAVNYSRLVSIEDRSTLDSDLWKEYIENIKEDSFPQGD